MAEVELKFELPPEAHPAFSRLPALSLARPSHQRLLAMYFDTPSHDLAKNEMAMRLRRSGRQWVQSLKSGASGAGGLHERDEWESDRPGPSIDLSLFAQTPLAKLPDAESLHRNLGEIFRVEVARSTWELEIEPGTRVEIALDRGEVRNSRGAEPISEVEIEILEGERRAVFDFAERLVEEAPLRPSALTKAQRGYRLAGRGKTGAVKSRAAKLTRGMTPLDAARASIGAALTQMQANESGALTTSDPEYLHQLRVALRRLRTALRVFREVLDPEFARFMDGELRTVARSTGASRDWDVFATQTLPEFLDAYGDAPTRRAIMARAAAKRRAAREAMRESLRSPRHARTMLALARWLSQPPQGAANDSESLAKFAARAVRKRHRKLAARGKDAAHLDAAARHKLRIEAKRVRYAFEAFAPLFPRKRVEAYLKALSELQDDLGAANDAVVAAALARELALPAAAAKLARRWFGAQERAGAALMARHFDKLAATRHFWEER